MRSSHCFLIVVLHVSCRGTTGAQRAPGSGAGPARLRGLDETLDRTCIRAILHLDGRADMDLGDLRSEQGWQIVDGHTSPREDGDLPVPMPDQLAEPRAARAGGVRLARSQHTIDP